LKFSFKEIYFSVFHLLKEEVEKIRDNGRTVSIWKREGWGGEEGDRESGGRNGPNNVCTVNK
jgi:hypothetical protein